MSDTKAPYLFILPEGGVDLREAERGLIVQALVRTKHNQTQAARLLGISRYALRYRMEKFGMSRPAHDVAHA